MSRSKMYVDGVPDAETSTNLGTKLSGELRRSASGLTLELLCRVPQTYLIWQDTQRP
jgi:hypothetical protein